MRCASSLFNRLDVSVRDLTSDIDFILLACDGLFEEMSNEEVVDFVSERIGTKTAQEITDELGMFETESMLTKQHKRHMNSDQRITSQ